MGCNRVTIIHKWCVADLQVKGEYIGRGPSPQVWPRKTTSVCMYSEAGIDFDLDKLMMWKCIGQFVLIPI